MQDFFRCQEGMEAEVEVVTTKAYRKLVMDLIYEARIQAIITYNATVEGRKVRKDEARRMSLSQAQYIQVSDSF
jgi:hypothetical protein